MTFLGATLIQHAVDLALIFGHIKHIKGLDFELAWLAVYPTRWLTLVVGISAAFRTTSSNGLRLLLAVAAIGVTALSTLGPGLEIPLACWIAGKRFPLSAD